MRIRFFHILFLITFPFVLFGEARELRFHYLSTENGLPRNTAYSVTEDKYGFIWIATIDGLCRFDGYNVKQYYAEKSNPKSIYSNRPRIVMRDSRGDIWITFASLDPVCKYNYETDDFSRFEKKQLPKDFQRLLAEYDTRKNSAENKDYRWVIKSNLLFQTNKRNQQQITYRFDPNNNYGLKDGLVVALFLDSRNTLWVATDAGGVCYADVNQPDFRLFHIVGGTSKNIQESTVRAICQTDDGNLWIGMRRNGLVRIDERNSRSTFFRFNKQNPSGISDDRIRRIFKDSSGRLWIGNKMGMDRFDPASNRFVHYPAINNRHIDNWVYAIEEDKHKDLWVGTWQAGIARFDPEKKLFIPYKAANPDYTWNIRALLREGERNLWIGTEGNGLALLKRKLAGGKELYSFTRFTHQAQHENTLSDNRVYCLCKDRFGYLWIGTGKGLNRFDPRTGQFLHFAEKRFISGGMIFGILADEKNNLWISHQYGLTRLNCRTFRTADYTNRDDLFNTEFSEDAFFRNTKTGECFLGGNLGVISFNPHSITDNPYPPEVVVTDFRIDGNSLSVHQMLNGRVVLEKPAYLTSSVTLKWTERNIELEFAALHFANPKNNTYAYRLVGLNSVWKNTDATNRTVSYTNLSPGRYRFEVKAANSNGIWSKTPTVMEIIILPPWWKSGWAYLFYACCVAGLIYLAYRIVITREKLNHQIQIERLRAEKAKELEELKSTFFTNVSHELRTPLTLIIDPIKKLVEGSVPDAQTSSYFHKLILENSKRLLALVNQLLDLKKVESGEMQLNLSRLEVVSKVRSLVGMFELQALEHRIKLGFRSSEEEIVTGVDVDKLDKIILNLLSNAFKFTPDGGTIQLEITQSNSNASFEITVKDSGTGIPAEKIGRIFDPFYQVDGNDQKNGTGIGLSLVKDFVALHQGTIAVESEVGQGTCFRLTFPINESDELISGVAIHSGEIDANSEVVINSNETVEETANELPVILVVEDNAEVRQYLQTILLADFRVMTAINGCEGFDLAVESIPDLVVSDIMMPEVSGVELCERLKTDQRTSHIPVVLLTARQSEELRITGYETGADDYITKPFSSATLIARIKNLIESRHKLRQLFDKSTGFNTKVIAANQVDKLFLDTLVSQIHENMAGETFDAEELASMMNMSRVQLNRKIKSLTDKTTKEFVLTVRLNKAAELLLSGMYNVNEVSEMVGYSEPGNFTRSFTRQFGESPKSYVASRRG
jgi:Signal transduction histidine kinase